MSGYYDLFLLAYNKIRKITNQPEVIENSEDYKKLVDNYKHITLGML